DHDEIDVDRPDHDNNGDWDDWVHARWRLVIDSGHLDRDRELLRRGGAEHNSTDGRDVGIVATPSDRHMARRGRLIVGRIDVEPSMSRDVDRTPRVRRIGAAELRSAPRRLLVVSAA